MVKKLNIGLFRITWTFRYPGDKYERSYDKYKSNKVSKSGEIGIFWDYYSAVSIKNAKTPSLWGSKMGRGIQIGIRFIWIKTWIKFSYNIMDF